VFLFECLCLSRLCFQVRIDFRLIGVVIGKGRMNLRQRQMAELPDDFFWNQTHVVPLSDPANGDSSPGNARPPAANVGTPRDQASYLGHSCHRLQVYRLDNTPPILQDAAIRDAI
jgi:hypothetical protein